jgi:hypothetical protein
VHPGDGDVARAIRAMQRKHFDPPELQPRVKRPRGFIMVAVSMVGNLHERRPSEPPLGGDKMRLLAIVSFGIAVLGLFTIFNSTSTQISLVACIMYIVGAVIGVLLLQTES